MRTSIFISYLTLLSGLSISFVAIYYSVTGLISIFSGAATSIIVMGSTLELSKLVATVWLKRFWNVAPTAIKAYLISAIIILMIITSLGTFGYLARANVEQTAVSGDIEDKLLIIDDKIKIQQDILDSARKSLSQLDSSVDQILSRSETDKGALKSFKIRQTQQEERKQLQLSISDAQNNITKLKEEKAPISIQSRKSQVEYGPIRFVAQMLFKDGASNLDAAVRYVIILIVIVFDPLAVILLLCSQYSFSHINTLKQQQKEKPIFKVKIKDIPEETSEEEESEEIIPDEPISEQDDTIEEHSIDQDNIDEEIVETNLLEDIIEDTIIEQLDSIDEHNEKIAKSYWKQNNKNDTIKHQEKLFHLGLIDKLPWEK